MKVLIEEYGTVLISAVVVSGLLTMGVKMLELLIPLVDAYVLNLM